MKSEVFQTIALIAEIGLGLSGMVVAIVGFFLGVEFSTIAISICTFYILAIYFHLLRTQFERDK